MNRFTLLPLFTLCFALTGCSSPGLAITQPTPTATAPQVIINSPASGTQHVAGTDVVIQSTSSDAEGIMRVELLVDGQSVRSDAIPTGKSQPQFQVTQMWKATTPGTHIVIVRAANERGATGEASLSLTVVDATKPTTGPAVPTSAPPPAATKPPAATAPPAALTSPPAPVATKAPAPTTAPSTQQYTLTLTEAQVNAIVNGALGASQLNYISNASVTLQNGQISIGATYAVPGAKPVTGQIVVAVSASNCALHVTVVQASIGLFTMTEAQKAALSQSIEKALKSQLAQTHAYTCVDSITIANGVMTIKYH